MFAQLAQPTESILVLRLDHDLRLVESSQQTEALQRLRPSLQSIVELIKSAKIGSPHPWLELLRDAVAESYSRPQMWIKFNWQEIPGATWTTTAVRFEGQGEGTLRLMVFETVSLLAVTNPIAGYANDLLNHINEMLVVTDSLGRLVFANQAFRAATGFVDSDIYGRTLEVVFQQLNPDQAIKKDLTDLLKRLADTPPGVELEAPLGDRTLLCQKAEQALASEAYDPGSFTIFTARDITDLRRRDLALLNSSRMVALGEQAAGIAHEINNPLAIILSKSEVVLSRIPEDSPARKPVLQILETAGRIAKIVRGLKNLARRPEDRPAHETHCLANLVRENLEFLSDRFAKEKIEVCFSAPEHSCLSPCDPIQIGQVLINLLQNAADALCEQPHRQISVELNLELGGQGLAASSGRQWTRRSFAESRSADGAIFYDKTDRPRNGAWSQPVSHPGSGEWWRPRVQCGSLGLNL